MSNHFGSIIKNMRKQRNLTQEQFSEVLGVSCQAVSKWETCSSYPDLSLLPVIADYFGVSIDFLLGHDIGKQKDEIRQICAQADALVEKGAYFQAIPLLREMLARHPGNEKLMYALAWALSGTLKDSPENYEEAICLYVRILEISRDTELRTKVARDLMYRYYTKNDLERASWYANQLPPFALCREYNLGRGNLLEGKALAEYLQSNIRLFGNALRECLEYFESENILTAEEKAPYTTESAKEKIKLLKEIIG